MKRSLILTCVLITAIPLFAGNKKNHREPHVHVLNAKMNIFYFCVPKELIGASIEVYSPDGEKILSDTIRHSKMLLDFYNEDEGHYTIKVMKNTTVESFDYYKCYPSPLNPLEANFKELKRINISLLKKKVEWRYA